MEFLAYFRAVRRHWLIIFACVVLGAALGAGSTRLESDPVTRSRTFYRATHTFFFDPSTNNAAFASAFTNLDQMAVRTTTGAVTDAAAEELGTGETGRELAQHITTLTSAATSTLEITAVDADETRAEELADAFARNLVATLSEIDLARYNSANSEVDSRVRELQASIDELIGQIASQPPNAPTLQAQLLALQNRYTKAYEDLQEIASTDPPTSALTTLETAEAIPIDRAEYQARLARGQLGDNNQQAGVAGAVPLVAPGGSDPAIDGPFPRGVLGGLLGLLAGLAVALFVDRLDVRIRDRDDAARAFDLPVLAEVPKLSAREQREYIVAAQDAPMSPAAETYRAIRSALLFQHSVASPPVAPSPNGDGPHHEHGADPGALFGDDGFEPLTVMVASASPGEGKTTMSANLAAVFAESGASVLVVNCDFRRPMVHRYLGIDDTPRRVCSTRVPGVKAVTNVLADPDANPARVLAEQRRLIAAARGQFDVLILDTAPLLSANDAVELVGGADLVLVVARTGQSSSREAQRAVELLRRVEAPVAGVALIGGTEAANGYYAYYRREPVRGDRRRARERRRDERRSRNDPRHDDAEAPTEMVAFTDEPRVS